MSMLSRSQRTAFKAEQINDAVVLDRKFGALERFPLNVNLFVQMGIP